MASLTQNVWQNYTLHNERTGVGKGWCELCPICVHKCKNHDNVFWITPAKKWSIVWLEGMFVCLFLWCIGSPSSILRQPWHPIILSFSFAWSFVFKFLFLISHWTGAWRIVNSHHSITLWTIVSAFTDSLLRASHSYRLGPFRHSSLPNFGWMVWINGCLICWLVDQTV